jgi:hypothetical protein
MGSFMEHDKKEMDDRPNPKLVIRTLAEKAKSARVTEVAEIPEHIESVNIKSAKITPKALEGS